jgi:hypothetical protein
MFRIYENVPDSDSQSRDFFKEHAQDLLCTLADSDKSELKAMAQAGGAFASDLFEATLDQLDEYNTGLDSYRVAFNNLKTRHDAVHERCAGGCKDITLGDS